jgi:hypothetical protein
MLAAAVAVLASPAMPIGPMRRVDLRSLDPVGLVPAIDMLLAP